MTSAPAPRRATPASTREKSSYCSPYRRASGHLNAADRLTEYRNMSEPARAILGADVARDRAAGLPLGNTLGPDRRPIGPDVARAALREHVERERAAWFDALGITDPLDGLVPVPVRGPVLRRGRRAGA